MVEDLICCGWEFSATHALLHPSGFVAIVALGPGFGAEQNDVALIGRIHVQIASSAVQLNLVIRSSENRHRSSAW